MTTAPRYVDRQTQPYAAVRTRIARADIADVAPREIAAVSAFLAAHEIAAVGPPLIRYIVVDYGDGEVEVDIGIPIGTHAITSDERIRLAVLPAGRYATAMHLGEYPDIVHTTASLLDSAQREGIAWAVHDDRGVTHWAGRVEHYRVGPPAEHDPAKWRTEIAILVREPQARAVAG